MNEKIKYGRVADFTNPNKKLKEGICMNDIFS